MVQDRSVIQGGPKLRRVKPENFSIDFWWKTFLICGTKSEKCNNIYTNQCNSTLAFGKRLGHRKAPLTSATSSESGGCSLGKASHISWHSPNRCGGTSLAQAAHQPQWNKKYVKHKTNHQIHDLFFLYDLFIGYSPPWLMVNIDWQPFCLSFLGKIMTLASECQGPRLAIPCASLDLLWLPGRRSAESNFSSRQP